MKKKIIILLTIFLFPLNTIYAYSNKIYAGGNSIGIEVNTKGVLVAGFYKIKGKYNESIYKLKEGDYIIGINDDTINNISSLNESLTKHLNDKSITLHVLRNNILIDVNLKLIYDNGKYKTGIYVKDKVSGIGTLTYIDPETNIYGALGHQITVLDTTKALEIENGYIFPSLITGIIKSSDGRAGSKNAFIDNRNIYGKITKNDMSGIYGKYEKDYNHLKLYEVGNIKDIKKGNAIIRTVIDEDKVEEFTINILNIDISSSQKNLLFEVTDKRLLSKTGGIVQGMSGSPIIQNNKIIGAVNYVILDNPDKGYGILITKMLEKGES